MVICFKCSPETKRTLDSLITSGNYSDYSDVITAALSSFAVLTAEVGKKGSVLIEGSLDLKPGRPSQRAGLPSPSDRTGPVAADGERASSAALGIPLVFSNSDLPAEPPAELAPRPTDVFVPGQAVPLDRWIFGQYNKLLPVKASCRALANLSSANRAGFEIDSVAAEVAQAAATLGIYLEAHDARHSLSRDEALATGFPSSRENGDRSRLRYANQFVASINKKGQVSGLLIDLKFINLTSNRSRRIQLTRSGWDLAGIENPILDGAQRAPADKFSQSEKAFLIDHVSNVVPTEDFAYRTILKVIKQGKDRPDQLDAALQLHVPEPKRETLSKTFVTTQRSGVISRMADLGLINRVRDGVRVSYVLTDTGEEYSRRAAAA